MSSGPIPVERPEPGRQVRAVAEGALLRGPFSGASPWSGQASSGDGKFSALAAANFDRWEVWAFRRDGSGLRRLLRVDQYPLRWGTSAWRTRSGNSGCGGTAPWRVLVEGPFHVSGARVERGSLVFLAEALEGLSHPWVGYLHLLDLRG